MSRVRPIYILCLLLALSLACKGQLMLVGGAKLGGAERLRSFVAAILWERADMLMHRGAIDPVNQKFKAGSYVGNTDIIPLLKLVTHISPEELAPYQLLARSLAYAQGNPDEGIRVLQECLVRNPRKHGLHEIYASMAFLKLFFNSEVSRYDREVALNYLRSARLRIIQEEGRVSTDPAFTLENYTILMASLLVDLGRSDMALEVLEEADISLYGPEDLIFAYLAEYKNTGIDKESFLRNQAVMELGSVGYSGHSERTEVGIAIWSGEGGGHRHEGDCCGEEGHGEGTHGEERYGAEAHGDNKALPKTTHPTLKYFFAILRSGLLFMLLLVFSR
jgi:tetratricopeptide (TPR) repeat protein